MIPSEPTQARHAQLDGLRAIAMCGVLYVHLFNRDAATENLRVSLFFVLSGFLITHILLTAKDSGRRLSILHFYIRRALRLFPALVLLVIAASAFNMDGTRASAFWHLAQLSNVYFVTYHAPGDWHPWVLGHLWSLNVVEQFYLVAPLLVLLLPRRRLLVTAACIWIITVFLRTNAPHVGVLAPYVYNVLCYDPIFAGVLTCLLLRNDGFAEMVRSRLGTLVALLVFAMPLYMWADFGHSESYRLLIQPALGLIVAQAYFGFSGPIGWLLGSAPAGFLARISYGVYLYHLAIWWGVSQVYPPMLAQGWAALMIVSVLSVLMATLTWYLIESPISRLKRYFPVASKPYLQTADRTDDGSSGRAPV
jgi:peptidoglycan/LPS O-acetylase OafA/YrhL